MDEPLPEQTEERSHIFVSYAHEDAGLVYPEIDRLRAEGFDVWYDEGISPGRRWSDEVATSLKNAGVFVYFITENSVRSPHCQDETNLALDAGKPTIAVYLQPTELTPGLQLRLSSQQAILKYELAEQDYQARLSAAIATYVQHTETKRTPATRPMRTQRLRTALIAGGLAVVALMIGAFVMLSPAPAPDRKGTTSSEPEAVSATDAPTLPEKPSIAVLPFTNLSGDPEQEYFSDGMAEDILNALVQNTDMKVIARTSSFQFKGKNVDIREIGDVLGVTHIVEGSVRKAGNRIRVTAQLNSTEDGAHIWSDQYDRELNDIFAVQDDITRRVVNALNAELTGDGNLGPATDNVEAHRLWLLGVYHNARRRYQKAIDALEEAIALDPQYTPAYVGLAFVHTDMASSGLASWREKIPIVRALYGKARQLDPANDGVHALDAWLSAYVERDYQTAIDTGFELCRVQPLACNIYGNLLHRLGYFESAIDVFDRALEVNPISPMLLQNKGSALLWAGRFDEALDAFEMQENLGVPSAYHKSLVASLRGDLSALRNEVTQGNWANAPASTRTLYRARLAYAEGDSEMLRTALDQLSDISFAPVRITASLLEGNLDRALTTFEEMASTPSSNIYFTVNLAKISPLYAEFSEHPRFHRVLEDIGLDKASLAKLTIPQLPED